jgi:hypothetical protein
MRNKRVVHPEQKVTLEVPMFLAIAMWHICNSPTNALLIKQCIPYEPDLPPAYHEDLSDYDTWDAINEAIRNQCGVELLNDISYEESN